MPDYPGLEDLASPVSIGDILTYPNAIYPYFWGWILLGIGAIITMVSYFAETERRGVGKILSSMAVASVCVLVLMTVGSLAGFIELEVMVLTLVICLGIIGVWFFATR